MTLAAPATASAPPRAVVVGGGPAGSLAAMVLAKRGIRVDVFERMDMETLQRKTNRSYPMVISPRAWLGLEEAGAPVASLPCTQEPVRGFIRNGVTAGPPFVFTSVSYAVDRASLARDMAEAALRLYPETVTYHGGAELQGVAFDERRVTVRLKGADGQEHLSQVPYDLLVGADGVNSAVRRCLEAQQPGFKAHTVLAAKTGYKSYSGLPSVLSDGSEAVPGIGNHTPGQYLYSWTPPESARSAENPDNRLPGLTMKMDPDRTLSGMLTRSTDFRPQVLADALRATFPAIPNEWVESLVQQTQEGAQPLSPWGRIVWCDHFHGPRTVLLGDAAHAVTSSLGQGCNIACESVRVFARAYDAVGGDLDALPATFSRMREADAHAMQMIEKMQVLTMPVALAGAFQLSEPLLPARLYAQVVLLLPTVASMLMQRLVAPIKAPSTIFAKINDPTKPYGKVLREAQAQAAAVLAFAGALAAALAAAVLAAVRVAPVL